MTAWLTNSMAKEKTVMILRGNGLKMKDSRIREGTLKCSRCLWQDLTIKIQTTINSKILWESLTCSFLEYFKHHPPSMEQRVATSSYPRKGSERATGMPTRRSILLRSLWAQFHAKMPSTNSLSLLKMASLGAKWTALWAVRATHKSWIKWH